LGRTGRSASSLFCGLWLYIAFKMDYLALREL
jgi:hypothetical protein